MRLFIYAALAVGSFALAIQGAIHPWIAGLIVATYMVVSYWIEVRCIFRNRRDPRHSFRYGWWLGALTFTAIAIGLMAFTYRAWGVQL